MQHVGAAGSLIQTRWRDPVPGKSNTPTSTAAAAAVVVVVVVNEANQPKRVGPHRA
jgi:hypothetical protein